MWCVTAKMEGRSSQGHKFWIETRTEVGLHQRQCLITKHLRVRTTIFYTFILLINELRETLMISTDGSRLFCFGIFENARIELLSARKHEIYCFKKVSSSFRNVKSNIGSQKVRSSSIGLCLSIMACNTCCVWI